MRNGSFTGHSKCAVESRSAGILLGQRKRMIPPYGKGRGDPDGTLKQYINGEYVRPQRGGHAESCMSSGRLKARQIPYAYAFPRKRRNGVAVKSFIRVPSNSRKPENTLSHPSSICASALLGHPNLRKTLFGAG